MSTHQMKKKKETGFFKMQNDGVFNIGAVILSLEVTLMR